MVLSRVFPYMIIINAEILENAYNHDWSVNFFYNGFFCTQGVVRAGVKL